jgi:hypothetical protein
LGLFFRAREYAIRKDVVLAGIVRKRYSGTNNIAVASTGLELWLLLNLEGGG